MGRILYPPEIVSVEGGVIFLAGPIQGASLWQEDAARIIGALDDGIIIACPRRNVFDGGDFRYQSQIDWETHYLRLAGRRGVVLFWLAKEHKHDCDRAYAQTSRFELGEWKVRHERDGAKLVLGIEPGFTNERYIHHRMAQDCPEVAIHESLDEACRAAIRLFHS